ncbi:MAG: hypothetical protein KAT46_05505, partial [Deltaproteobacteria bacterium]|nr:hypothetical protein [Deltaproteobacteria bacterium]
GVVTEGVLRALAFIMRLVGNITMSFSRAGVHIYDLIIFLPLGIESLVRGGKQGIKKGPNTEGSL